MSEVAKQFLPEYRIDLMSYFIHCNGKYIQSESWKEIVRLLLVHATDNPFHTV